MFSKRGISQADWIISIGIFLLYLAWFFVVIRPVIAPETKESLPSDDLKDSFMENASWQVNITPVIIRSDVSSTNEPIIIEYPFEGRTDNYALKEGYWTIDEGKLMFLGDISQASEFSLIHSSYNYTKPSVDVNMEASEHTASTAGIEVNFDESLIDSLRYKNGLKISGFSMRNEGKALSTSLNSFVFENIFAKYKVSTSSLNNTCYVFDQNPRVYCYVDSKDNSTVNLDFTLHRYDSYYVNTKENGDMIYNVTSCDDFETDFIDFSDDDYGMAFIFSKDVDIEMCHDSDLSLDIGYDGSFSYRIVMHSSDADKDDLSSSFSAVFGVVNVIEGLSRFKMERLEDYSYSDLKSSWKQRHDFNITVYNSTADFLRIGKEPYSHSNINSKIYYAWILDQYANQTRATINILMW